MSTDPFGNPSSKPAQPPAGRVLRRVAYAEIALGLVLLIVGFAIGDTLIALIGAVIVASSGTLFVLARSVGRRGRG